MKNLNRREARPAVSRAYAKLLTGLAALTLVGCDGGGERDENDGTVINGIVLPTDVVLSLHCANVGIADETCVLDDPENPFVNTFIPEFDVNNPDAVSKFELIFDLIPRGPTGAKARFYFWATALARRQSGENQYYTALALHELFDANSNALNQDELIRGHALKAYRSVLDNFFGSVTVFKCFTCGFPEGEEPESAQPLNERVADHMFRTASTDFVTPIAPDGLRRLVALPDSLVLDLFVDWGYSYQPCTDTPACTNGVVAVAEFFP
jgi:hypothetical protein